MNIWTQAEEAARLHERFDRLKTEAKIGQAKFARDYAVPGGASMVSQHIKNRRPINLEHASAYMRGFGCQLHEISPRLALEVSGAGSALPLTSSVKAGLSEALQQLSAFVAGSDDLTRDQLKPLFNRMLDEPQRSNEILHRIESVISSSTGARSGNMPDQDMPGFLKK